MEIAAIRKRLASLRLKVRTLFVAEGLTKCILAMVAFAIVSFVLDYWLRFPWPVRMILLAGWLSALLYVFFKHLWHPATVRMTDDDLALCVEKSYPMLGDRLISSLQLVRTVDDDPYSSEEMVSALVAETAQVIGSVNFRSVAKAARLIIYVLVLIALLMPVTIFALFDGQDRTRIWFQRAVLLRDTPWPQLTTLALSNRDHLNSLILPQDGELTINALATRKLPEEATFVWRLEGSKNWRSDAMSARVREKGPHGQPTQPFRYTLKSIRKAFTFYVKAGDARTPEFSIPVVGRPRVLGNPIPRATLPAYMPSSAQENFNRRGNNTDSGMKMLGIHNGTITDLPAYSTVQVQVETSAEVDAAALHFHDPQNAETEIGEPLKMTPNGTATYAASFLVPADRLYSIRLIKNHSRNADSPVFPIENSDRHITYSITSVYDKAPVVAIDYPQGDKYASTESVIHIKGTTTDDYELGAVSIQYALFDERPSPNEPLAWNALPIREFTGVQRDIRTFRFDFPLKLSELEGPVRENSFLIYRVVATDRHERAVSEAQQKAYADAKHKADNLAAQVRTLTQPEGFRLPAEINTQTLQKLITDNQTSRPASSQSAAERTARTLLNRALKAQLEMDAARQENQALGNQQGTSKTMVMEILPINVLRERLLEKLAKTRASLGRLYDDQVKIKEAVNNIASDPSRFKTLKHQLPEKQETQGFISGKLSSLARDFAAVADEFNEAGVFADYAKIIPKQVVPLLHKTATEVSPEAAREIAKLRLDVENKEKMDQEARAITKDAMRQQQIVLRNIQEVFDVLPAPSELIEILKDLRKLQGRLEEIQRIIDGLSSE